MTSALKSAAWLLKGAALATVFLAFLGLVGFIIYLPIAHRAYLRSVTIAVQSASWVAVFGHLTWVLAAKRPRSSAQLVPVISEAVLLLCITIALLFEGANLAGWAHGPFGYAIAGVGLVFLLFIAAYWVYGERRLKAVLERRAAERQVHS